MLIDGPAMSCRDYLKIVLNIWAFVFFLLLFNSYQYAVVYILLSSFFSGIFISLFCNMKYKNLVLSLIPALIATIYCCYLDTQRFDVFYNNVKSKLNTTKMSNNLEDKIKMLDEIKTYLFENEFEDTGLYDGVVNLINDYKTIDTKSASNKTLILLNSDKKIDNLWHLGGANLYNKNAKYRFVEIMIMILFFILVVSVIILPDAEFEAARSKMIHRR